ncbi:hypothetical protein ACUJ8S_00780 [Proteus mirabilis]|uniref:hypothetical protein n=1 Tax=Proteus mirabilis TaxID=584 RepID=UPI0023F9932E|nr:hypothetical protein [Proteus mirabilis]MDF7242967.1 hypothetical protein [Proteus mirabilis]MDM3661203.1 hypothetical protein [Proteus mirabilis]MDM3675865.1 hypothetical protein [Proteus mirabilis]
MITSIPIAALITSTVAVSLFIAKEIRESIKKKKSNKIMLNGLCYMIQEQVNFNEAIIKELLKIKKNVNNDEYDSWSVERIESNSYITFKKEGKSKKGSLITMPKYNFFEKEIKELSILDEELFNRTIELISAMQALHIEVTALLVMLHENKKDSKSLGKFLSMFDDKINKLYIPALLSVRSRCELITKKPN